MSLQVSPGTTSTWKITKKVISFCFSIIISPGNWITFKNGYYYNDMWNDPAELKPSSLSSVAEWSGRTAD